ncbi:M56 family metallopeptidase [Marinilabilia sp.]
MISYANWLYESSVLVAGMVIIFQVFLKRKTTFTFNRALLLGGLIIALLLPFSSISLFDKGNGSGEFSMLLTPVTIASGDVKSFVINSIRDFNIYQLAYFSGVILLLFRLFHGLIKLGLLSRTASFAQYGRFKVTFLPGDFSPFSFFNMVFIGKNAYDDEEIKQIIAHETAHSRKWHSLDVILLELVLIPQWFNPFVWILRRNLMEIHEFQADREVLQQGVSLFNYKRLLLYQRTGARLELVNNFHKSFIKKRFIMMTKNNKPTKRNVILASIGVMIFFTGFMACNRIENDSILSDSVGTLKSEGKVYNLVDEMPEYPGGEQELKAFLANNTIYPEEAVKNKYQGRVYVQFVINETGKVTNTKVVRSSGHPVLDEEALRVIKSLPAWTPGKIERKNVSVNYTVPINFRLSDNKVIRNDKSKE